MVSLDDAAIIGSLIGVSAALLAQAGAFVWWASKTDTTQRHIADTIERMADKFEEHMEHDHQFQLRVVERLGDGAPPKRSNGGH